MDDQRQVAGEILKMVGSFCLAGLAVYIWGVLVVGTPFRVFARLGTLVQWTTRSVVYRPARSAQLWKALALVGIAASTTLAFWMHSAYYRSFIDNGRAYRAAKAGAEPATQSDPLSDFVPGVEWTAPTSWPIGVMCFLFFLPIAALHVPILRNRFRLMSECEIEGHYSFAAMALGLSLLVHAGLFYTPLGGLVYQGLNAITNAGVYLGVVLAIIVLEYGWGVLRNRR